MVEKSLEINTSSNLSVLYLDEEKWRSYRIGISSDNIFKEESDSGYHPHRLKVLFDSLIKQDDISKWWNLCFILDNGKIKFDEYYLNLPIGENTDKTFKQLFDSIINELPDISFSQGSSIFFTGNYTKVLPLVYLIQQKYLGHLIIEQKENTLTSPPILTLYSGIENQMSHFNCFKYENKKLIYLPYLPGESCKQAYVWIEQDSMQNFYLCMSLNNHETNIIPWMN